MREVPPGPPDQVPRLERYRQEHPDVDIQPPGAQSAVWRAFRDGELIAYGFTLMVFMDRLEALPEPLGGVQISIITVWLASPGQLLEAPDHVMAGRPARPHPALGDIAPPSGEQDLR